MIGEWAFVPGQRGLAAAPHRSKGARPSREPSAGVTPGAVHHAQQLRRRRRRLGGRTFDAAVMRGSSPIRWRAPTPFASSRRGPEVRARRHDARPRGLRRVAAATGARLRAQLRDAMHSIGQARHPGRRRGDDDAYVRRAATDQRRALPDALRRALSQGDPGPIASQHFYVTQARRIRVARPAVEADPHDRRLRLRLERRRSGRTRTGRTNFDFQEMMRAARGPTAAASALRSGVAQSVHDVDRRGLHRPPALVSRRHHRVQRDARRPSARRGRPRALAPRRRGSVAVERASTADGIARCRRQPAPHAAGLRRRVRRHRRDPRSSRYARRTASATSASIRTTGCHRRADAVQVPMPYVFTRTGGQQRNAHRVALTFDDGPDATWTPMILDTLRSRGVKATFFVIGAERGRAPRRCCGASTPKDTRSATTPSRIRTWRSTGERRDRARARRDRARCSRRCSTGARRSSGRRTSATPSRRRTTSSCRWGSRRERGYFTIGLHVDCEDWQDPGRFDHRARARAIVPSRTRMQRHHARTRRATSCCSTTAAATAAQTVAALGPLIDSLRARGDTHRARVASSPASRATRRCRRCRRPARRRASSRIGGLRRARASASRLLFWIFIIAVVLGVGAAGRHRHARARAAAQAPPGPRRSDRRTRRR